MALKVLVTGGTKGIGKAIALAFAGAGADVAVSFKKDAVAANQFKQQLEANGDTCILLQKDVGNADEAESAVKLAADCLGGLDILVNNAGISVPRPLLELADNDWDLVMNTNVKGPFVLCKAAAQMMKTVGQGIIINISSMSGLEPYPGMGAYSVSKASLVMLTRLMALEWAEYGIRVNAICPGLIRTPLTEAVYADSDLAQKRAELVPLRRIGTPEDIADIALFLASSAASYITGQVIVADGGLLGSIQRHLAGRPATQLSVKGSE